MQVDHRVSGNSVWIGAEGLGQTLKVLHVTDSHISGDGETEAPFDDYSARMHDAYSQYDRKGAFRRAMDLAVAERVDLIALTGDQVNYPSISSVAFVRREIERIGIPHLYTSGNHDWHYEGMPGRAVETFIRSLGIAFVCCARPEGCAIYCHREWHVPGG